MSEFENENVEVNELEADVQAEIEAVNAEMVEAEAEAEAVEATPANLDDELFEKMQKAARLLRARRGALAQEAEQEAERMRDLQRALKLLELKPKMEQKEMADLMGMGLRDLNSILAEAEKHDIVARIEPEDADMRKVVVMAAEDANELIAEQGKKRKKMIPQLSAETAEQIIALMDEVINPLVEMGLDEDRASRSGRDDRRGGDRSHGTHGAPRMGFSGGRDRGGRDRGGRDDRRGNFGDRGSRNGGFRGNRDDRGGRGNFGDRDRRNGGFRGNRDDRSNRGGYRKDR